jgi:hypothetical protein
MLRAKSIHNVYRTCHCAVQRTIIKQCIRRIRADHERHIAVGSSIAGNARVVRIRRARALDCIDIEWMPRRIDRKCVGAAAAQGQSGIGDAVNHVGRHALIGDSQGTCGVAVGRCAPTGTTRSGR